VVIIFSCTSKFTGDSNLLRFSSISEIDINSLFELIGELIFYKYECGGIALVDFTADSDTPTGLLLKSMISAMQSGIYKEVYDLCVEWSIIDLDSRFELSVSDLQKFALLKLVLYPVIVDSHYDTFTFLMTRLCTSEVQHRIAEKVRPFVAIE